MSISCEKNYRIPRKTPNVSKEGTQQQINFSLDNPGTSTQISEDGVQKPVDLYASEPKEKTLTKAPIKNGIVKRNITKIQPKTPKSNSPAAQTLRLVQKTPNTTISKLPGVSTRTSAKKNGANPNSDKKKLNPPTEAAKKSKPDKPANVVNGGATLLDDIFKSFETTQKTRESPGEQKSPNTDAVAVDNSNVAGPSSTFQQPPTPVPATYRPLTRIELNRCDQDNGMVKVFLQKDGLMERILGFKMLRGRVEPYPSMRAKVDLETCVSPVYDKPADEELMVNNSPPVESTTPPQIYHIKQSESALRVEQPSISLDMVEPVIPIRNTPAINRGPKTPPGSPGTANSSRSSHTMSNRSRSEAAVVRRTEVVVAEAESEPRCEFLPPPPALPDLVKDDGVVADNPTLAKNSATENDQLLQMEPNLRDKKSINQQTSQTYGEFSLEECAMEISSESSESSKEEDKNGRNNAAAFTFDFDGLPPPPAPPEMIDTRPADSDDSILLVPPPPPPPNIPAKNDPVRIMPLRSGYYLTTAPPPGSSRTSPCQMPPMPILPIPCLFQQPPPNLSMPPPPIPTRRSNPILGPGPSTSAYRPQNHRLKSSRPMLLGTTNDDSNVRQTMATRYYPPPRAMPLNTIRPPPSPRPSKRHYTHQPTVDLDFVKNNPPPPIPEMLKKPAQTRPFRPPAFTSKPNRYKAMPDPSQPSTDTAGVSEMPGQNHVFKTMMQALSPTPPPKTMSSKLSGSFLRPPKF